MLKLKTNKSAKKRFRVTRHGKLKGFKPGKRHLLTSKSSDRKRRLRKSFILKGKVAKLTRKLLPYG